MKNVNDVKVLRSLVNEYAGNAKKEENFTRALRQLHRAEGAVQLARSLELITFEEREELDNIIENAKIHYSTPQSK